MPRRPRYSGTHPKHRNEKYKELNAERYQQDVEKILEAGRTPVGTHRPILCQEILEVLNPLPGHLVLDATLGYGGHTEQILKKILPSGRLIGLDQDSIQLPKTRHRILQLGYSESQFEAIHANFAQTKEVLGSAQKFDGILADLGLSSMQIDDPARGFSHKYDGPLDLRMDPVSGETATEVLSKLSAESLAKILTENSDEPYAYHFAHGILKAHQSMQIQTTQALRSAIRTLVKTLPRTAEVRDELTVVKRIFQALRIEVNQEFKSLDTFLENVPDLLKSGGRVAILTFHSGEDRRVKKAFQAGLKNAIYSEIATEVIRPSEDEIRSNSRAKPAKLRWAVRQ